MQPLCIVIAIRGWCPARAVRHGAAAGTGSCGGSGEALLPLAGGSSTATVGGNSSVGFQFGGDVDEAHGRPSHVCQRQMLLPPLRPPAQGNEGRLRKGSANKCPY